MAKQNLSQQVLMEVLTAEIETLKKATKDIKEVAPTIAKQLYELKTIPLKAEIDQTPLERFKDTVSYRLDKFTVIPQWMPVVFVIACAITIISTSVAIYYFKSYHVAQNTAQFWYEKAQTKSKK